MAGFLPPYSVLGSQDPPHLELSMYITPLLPGGSLGLNLFSNEWKQKIPILICTSLPHHSVPWTIHQPLVWGAIRPVQTQCKRVSKFRGYKAHFPRITLKPSLGGGCKGARLSLHPTPTNKVAAALLRYPPASPCSISALQLVYVLVLILYLVNLLLLLTLIVLFPCWCIGCPRNFIIFANNDNVMSSRSILLLPRLHFLHIDQALHYCVNYQHSWLFPNLKGISMQCCCTQGQLHGLSATSAVTQGPTLSLVLCCCCLEIMIIF